MMPISQGCSSMGTTGSADVLPFKQQEDHIAALKAAAQRAAAMVLPLDRKDGDKESASKKRARPFSRTISMPVLSGCATADEKGKDTHSRHSPSQSSFSFASSSRSNDSRQATKARSQRALSSSRSSCSSSSTTSSFKRSRRRAAVDLQCRGEGDSEDEEDEERSIRLRLGGCRPNSDALPQRDDNNKENVAPLRSLSERIVQVEASMQQEDESFRRTRTKASAPMSDRSGSISSVAASSRRHFQRTVSTPTTAHLKRGRVSETSAQSDDSTGLPSPTSRMRLENPSSDDTDSSYFSSQSTTIFDCASSHESSPLVSRCTTPDLDASQIGQEYDDKEEGDASDVETTMAIDDEDNESLSSLPGGNRDYANIFVHARILLRYGAGSEGQVIGRERERSTLHRFLQRRLGLFLHMEHSAAPQGDAFPGALDLDGARDSGSLYMCGMPGTGKTALVKSILNDVKQQTDALETRVIFIDCMTVQHPRELFRCVLQALQEDITSLPSGETGHQEAERRVNAIVADPSRKLLIVLDEIDHLMRSRVHQNILYQLFSWPAKSETCSLIGIANSLDLTERFVPLLASKGAAPAVLNFRPFEAQEIKRVLCARLALLRPRYGKEDPLEAKKQEDQEAQDSDDEVALFAPPALELLARKISAATGDLRKALDGARLAVEAVEAEYARSAREGKVTGDLSALTPATAPKAAPSHILRILSTVLGSPQLNKLRALTLQAKLVLLAYLVAHKRSGYNLPILGDNSQSHGGAIAKKVAASAKVGSASAVLLSDVEATYAAMLKNDEFAPLESSELMGVLEGLEVEGVVRFASMSAAPGRPSSKPVVARPVLGIARGGKRGPQSGQSNKAMVLAMSQDEVLRGITTAAPATRATSTSQPTTSSACSPVVAAAVKRIWSREEHNAERAKGWETQAALCARVRNDELGGGRGAIGI